MQRIARNEASFRDINERLEDGLRKVAHAPELQEFVCECGDPDCSELVHLTFEEYEHVRSNPRWFAVVPGHIFPEVEIVLERQERFELLEKIGATAEIAVDADMRS